MKLLSKSCQCRFNGQITKPKPKTFFSWKCHFGFIAIESKVKIIFCPNTQTCRSCDSKKSQSFFVWNCRNPLFESSGWLLIRPPSAASYPHWKPCCIFGCLDKTLLLLRIDPLRSGQRALIISCVVALSFHSPYQSSVCFAALPNPPYTA